jgi:hypothetical protein
MFNHEATPVILSPIIKRIEIPSLTKSYKKKVIYARISTEKQGEQGKERSGNLPFEAI